MAIARPPAGLELPAPRGRIANPLDRSAYRVPHPTLHHVPRLTVVTPSFNQAAYLEATLRSVLEQDYPNLEYFVVDGGSSDSSVRIIEHYAPWLSWWVSERDEGQTFAIEKGLRRATGDWFTWINSDDLLAPGALWKVAAAASTDLDVIAGATCHFGDHGLGRTYPPRNISASNLILEYVDSRASWHQPSTWLRTAALKEVGLNRGLNFAFDYEMLIRFLSRHPNVVHLPDLLAYFRFHEASKTVTQHPRFREEVFQCYRDLQRLPELAALHPTLRHAEASFEWFSQMDRMLADRGRSRLARLSSLIAEMRKDPVVRCNRHAYKTARRLLFYGGRKPV